MTVTASVHFFAIEAEMINYYKALAVMERQSGFDMGNNPMVGTTVVCAVAVQEASK